jgi:hypothetical protein
VTAITRIRRRLRPSLVVTLATAWLVTGSSLAFADETDQDVWVVELPGIACEDLYEPPGGQLTQEDTGGGFSQCVFTSPQGVSVFGWSVMGFNFAADPWYVTLGEESLVDMFGFSLTQESFGVFYEVDKDSSEWIPYFQGTVDTTPERWGIHLDGRLEVFGSPQAIEAILASTAERRQLIQDQIDRDENPDTYQSEWDLSAPDCTDLWDGAGLAPGYELFTGSRFQDFVECWVIVTGDNPYAYDSYPRLTFGYSLYQCPADLPLLREIMSFGEFQSEESFGLYSFYFGTTDPIVAGERTEYTGYYADEDDCALYSGWPEAIARMVDFRSGPGVTDQTESDSTIALPKVPTFSSPSVLDTTSAVGALAALVMASLLLAVGRPLITRLPSGHSPTSPASPAPATLPAPGVPGRDSGLPHHRRRTLLLWGLTLVSLALLTAVGANSVFGLVSGSIEQAALIALGVVATSTALLVLPIRRFPGAGVWQSHPVMWTIAMVLSWWMVTLVWGMSALVTSISTAVALAAVLLSHLIRRASSSTPLPQEVSQ